MKFYIALGGFACRALKEYSKQHSNHTFYYIDTDPTTAKIILDAADRFYLVSSLYYGTGAYRQIGRNATKREIYSGKLTSFFKEICLAPFADITILTSSFGGFGSAATIEILDLLEFMVFEKNKQNLGKHCRILAFTESMLKSMGVPRNLFETYRMNTHEMLSELSSRITANPGFHYVQSHEPIFNPECSFYLLDVQGYEEILISSFLDMSDTKLQQLDVQYRYVLKHKLSSPAVFISYSSKDQAIADMLVSSLKERKIESWIATQSIKEGSYAKQIIQGIRDAKIFLVLLSKNSIHSEQVKNEIDRAFARIRSGLKIIPFIIDDAELDDECTYYLCRQEFYFGKEPPIRERICELADKISDMLE